MSVMRGDYVVVNYPAQWQPIETAPKDGTWILVHHEWGIDFARWRPSDRWQAEGWETELYDRYGEPAEEIDPTHWMPLPDPPKQENDK